MLTAGRTVPRILSKSEQTQFHQQGFVIVSGVAPKGDVDVVGCILDRLFQRMGRPYGSIQNPLHLAPELRDSSVYQSCLAIAKQLLGRTAMYGCDTAIYKEPRGRHGTPWHQDAAFHSKVYPNYTVAFWIPLQDVTPENGCLQYIPVEKRHVLLPHRPYYPNDDRSLMTDSVDSTRAVCSSIRAGDAAIHGPLTLHSAPANSTDRIRRTWALTFRPWGKWGFLAPSRMFYATKVLHTRGLSQTGSFGKP